MTTRYRFTAAADGYSPTRTFVTGTLTFYAADDPTNHSTGDRWVLSELSSGHPDMTRAVYVIDDGASVTPAYVAGWNDDGESVYLAGYPLSVGIRPDNGRPVDMSSWALAPRRSYHLKVSE